jgi:hypothetical protein
MSEGTCEREATKRGAINQKHGQAKEGPKTEKEKEKEEGKEEGASPKQKMKKK